MCGSFFIDRINTIISQYIQLGDKIKKIFDLILIICFSLSYVGIKKDNSKIIYIDPGHGGIDGGCVASDGTQEKDINLSISLLLRDYLEKCGYVVKLTRVGDYDLASDGSKNRKNEDITKRCELMNEAYLYISIHANKYSSPNVRGAQTFYYGKNNKNLAEMIQKNLCNTLKNTTRKTQLLTGKYLLENVKSIGCLVEVGFISNPQELKLLKTLEYQEQIANTIGISILEYMEKSL